MKDQAILITGGTGSFGQAFARHALDQGARKVVVFSRDEAKQAAMRAAFSDPRLRFIVGDVREIAPLLSACRDIDIVIHAAALKRVETCEENPDQAVRTNVSGTINVARACIERGVRKAVFLSTDKAAAPNTLYGATKLAAERCWNASNVYSAGTRTRFAATRYGNVLGSTGSVVPLWKKQAVAGEIAVTHKDMTRFWMPMSAAVDLVTLALEHMRGGEVFVPKIGGSSLLALASAIAPGASIRTVGIRPGEKLHETLVTEDEARTTYDCGTHFVIEPESRSWGDVSNLDTGNLVPAGFTYRSDTAEQLSVDALQRLAA